RRAEPPVLHLLKRVEAPALRRGERRERAADLLLVALRVDPCLVGRCAVALSALKRSASAAVSGADPGGRRYGASPPWARLGAPFSLWKPLWIRGFWRAFWRAPYSDSRTDASRPKKRPCFQGLS